MVLAGGQALFLAISPLATLSAYSQGVGNILGVTNPGTTSGNVQSFADQSFNTFKDNFIAQGIDAGRGGTTILPTDVLPLPAAQERMSFGENLQLRALQRLPARFYFNTSVELSIRYETNPFQFPTKRKLLTQLPQPPVFRVLNQVQQDAIIQTINLSGNDDWIFRALPNVTAGWTLTPRTRIFSNYFVIRDYLFNNHRLNTTIQSVAGGIQQDIPVTRKGNLQAEFQFRELYQTKTQPVFDFLPALTFSYIVTPRTVAFINALLQMRGKNYFQAPTKELDPFYTFGFLYQRGSWSFSNTATFVQNFREPFRGNATIPVSNYSWICDFEVARRIVKIIPGLQAFVRAEPIWNFHSHNRPGLAGMDFRMFGGVRMAMGKPPLTAALEQIRQQLEEQEGAPPPAAPPGNAPPGEPKPSAFLMPYQVIAGTPQPIHGYLHSQATQQADNPEQPLTLTLQPVSSYDAPIPVVNTTAVATTSGVTTGATAASLVSSEITLQAPLTHKSEVPAVSPVVAAAEKSEPEMFMSPPPAISRDLPTTSILAAKPEESMSVPSKDTDVSITTSQSDMEEKDESSTKSNSTTKHVATKTARTKQHRTHKVELAHTASKPASHMQMILVPPLPAVNGESKENPFQGSGVDIKAPPMVLR